MFCVKTLSRPVERALRVSRRCTSVGSTRVTPTGLIAHAESSVIRSSTIGVTCQRFTLQYYDGQERFEREALCDLGPVRNRARGPRGRRLGSAAAQMDVGRGGRGGGGELPRAG